jgi:ABC transporter transmembrane region
VLECIGIGASVLFIAYGQVAFWLMTSHRQTFKIRAALLRAVLRQEIGWFDVHDSGGISTRLSEYVPNTGFILRKMFQVYPQCDAEQLNIQ